MTLPSYVKGSGDRTYLDAFVQPKAAKEVTARLGVVLSSRGHEPRQEAR